MDEQEFDLRGIVGLLRRQYRLILITLAVLLAAATVAVFVLKPVYTASTLVLVDPSRKDLLDPEAQITSASSDNARVDSEVELVKSDTVLLRVVKEADLLKDPEFGVRPGLRDSLMRFLRLADGAVPSGDAALQGVLDKLREAVSVQRRGLTYLILVQARSLTPDTAARIANTIARVYISAQVGSKVEATLVSRDIIQARIEEAAAAVAASEGSFDTFFSENFEAIAAETGRTDLVALRRQLEDANAARSRDALLADMVDGTRARRDWAALAESLKSDAVTALEQNRQKLLATLAGVAEGSERAIDLRAELGAIEASLDSAAGTELTNLRRDIAELQSRASDIRTRIRSSVLEAELPPQLLASIYSLQQNAEIARTQYQTLLSRLRDLEAQAYLQVADSRIVSEALPPNKPSFPNPRLIFALAGLGGLGLGVALAFLVENFVGGFTSEEQLEQVLKTAVVAAVPHQRDPKKAEGHHGFSVAEYVVDSPLSVFAETIRRARMGIDQALRRAGEPDPPAGGAVIMVTSSAPNEGKTTLALSLARAYALSGHRTLLIDCDLRKPGIHRQLGLEPSSGLLEYLHKAAGAPELPEIATIDDDSGAEVVLGARRSDVATDQLLSGATFARLLAAARGAFEIVIVDTPPVGPVVDGLYLARHADVIAFVVRWATTSQQEAKGALAALREAKREQTEIAVLLNQQEASRATYRNKYQGYYHEG